MVGRRGGGGGGDISFRDTFAGLRSELSYAESQRWLFWWCDQLVTRSEITTKHTLKLSSLLDWPNQIFLSKAGHDGGDADADVSK